MKQSFTSILAGLFVLAWSWIPVAVSAANPDDCTDPVINTVTSDLNDVCPATSVELTVDGVLNDATDWFWYTIDCGDTPVGSGATVTVTPTGTTTYYVRGEPGCVGDLPCASILITVLDPDAPTLSIPADVTIECGDPLTPVVDACTPIAVLHGEVALNLPASGSYLLDAAVFDLASADACGSGGLSFSFSPIVGDTERTIDCSDIGTQTLTIWVTDALNNQITAEVNLTVEDVIDDCNIGGGCHPMPLLLKHLVVSLDETGAATVSASTFDLSSVDICGEGPLSFSFSSDAADTDSTFTCANLGLDTLEVWVHDPAGNQVYATVEVTVQDPNDGCNGAVVACAPVAVFEEGIVAAIPANRELPLQALLFNQGSQDHCAAGSLSFAFSGTPSGAVHTFGCADLGLQTLTLAVTDGLGNVNTAEVSLHIQDLDANCQGVGAAYATDNCDPNPLVTFVDVSNPGNCGGQDTITRTWTATDMAGNSVSADQLIIIEDTEAPLIECPEDQTGTYDADCAFEVPSYIGLVTAGDDCDLLPEIVQSPLPGTIITASTTITITATDGCGNSSSCTFELTLSDDLAPTLTCLPDQIGLINTDCAFEVPDYSTQITFEDNCDPNPQFIQFPAAGSIIFEAATVSITLTDASGNSNTTCAFDITLPNAAPVLSELPADKDVECASQIPDSGGISAIDDCDGEVQVIFTQSGLPLDCVGNGTVINTWTATDSDGNTTSHSQTITILDETAPVLSELPTDITITCLDDLPADPQITAVDNCEGAIPVVYLQSPLPDCIGSGTVTRTWVAQDCNGNAMIHVQTITIEDTAEPGFSQYPGSLTVECLGDVPGDPGLTATDLCQGNIVVVFEQSMLPGCNGQGEVINTWTATDCAGNVSVHTQTVTINDMTPPVFSQQPADITVQCGADVPGDPGITATDNCDIDVEVFFTQTTLPACDEGGAVMNTWTASDCKGNTTTYTQIVTIEDTTPPIFSEEPANLTVDCVDEVPSPSALTATDNCDGEVSVTFQQLGYPPACVGSGIVEYTWTATDCAGNTATYTQVVTIMDNVAPTFSSLPADLTVDCAGAVPGDPGLTATDDCDGSVSVVFVQSADPACLGSGTVTNTWTATDCAGNSTVHVQTITVEDTTPPILSLEPNDMTVACLDDVPGDPGIVAVDGCSGPVSVVYEQSGLPLACSGAGTVINTWTATDCAGNATVITQTITIEDLTPPALSLKPTDLTIACEDDIPGNPGVTALDDCEGSVTVNFTQTGFPPNYPNPDPILNTWTATDCAGNVSTHTQIVTLDDNFVPIAFCKDITINLNGSGNASITPAMIDDGSWDNCGTVNLSLSQSDFDCTDVGVRPVTLMVKDLFDNQSVCIGYVSVIASSVCALPSFANAGGPTIADPCSCRTNGEFDEEVVVSPTGAGQMWKVVSTDLLNPLSMLPFGSGTLLTEHPAGPGQSIYSLAGVHLDGEGYIIVVESPFYPGQTLSISNTCYYPQPEILGLEGPFCLLSDPVLLEGDAGGVLLLSEDFTINGLPATSFDPSALGVGMHTVAYTVDAGTAASEDPSDPGCVSTITQNVAVVATPAGIACNNNLGVSLDQNCEAYIDPDMILEGNYLCYDDYSVSVSTGINSVPNPIPGIYAGETLIVTVTHLISGNSCWGTVTISDLLPPAFNCTTDPVVIYCTEDYQQVPPPVANENCTPVSYQLIDEMVVDGDACDDGVVRIHRVWIAIDAYGNESNPCIQVLEINRPDDVDFPNDITWSCEQYALFPSITNPLPLHPVVAALQNGTQTIDATSITSSSVLNTTGSGIPLDLDGQYCNYNYSHADQLIASCGTTFKILRTWTVLDWCTSTVVTLNNQGEDNVQLITILDDEGPVVTLAPFTVSANIPGVHPQPCTSQDFLNPAVVSDNCNSATIKIFTPVGEAVYVNGTNGAAGGFIPAPGLPLGIHPIIYQAVDACGNITELIVNVQVIDDITPVAICDEITEVSLSSNGQAVINASVFDDGSFDNCCIDHFEVRRMEDNCGINGNLTFGPNVVFCCADTDGNPHLVQVRVFDCFDNYNECMVQVYVEDKLPPSLVFCPGTQTITCDEYQNTFAAPLAAGNESILDVFGAPIFYDNCEAIVVDQVAVNVNACAEGTIQRTWTATDPSGNAPAICTQIIQVQHVSDWVVEFPADVSSTCVDGELPEFGEPEIFFDGCEMVGTSFHDMYFYIVPDACFKVIRTWTVVNWCIYDEFGYDAYAELSELDAGQDFDGDGDLDDRTFRDGVNNGPGPDGYIVYTQVLKVIDEDAPEFEVSDMNVCIEGTTCDTDIQLPIPDVVDCSDDVTIEITSNMPNQVGNTNLYADVPPGIYTANYEVYDNCGNISYDAITIEVEDCKLPTPYCKAGLIVEIMQTGMVPVPATLINDNSFDNCPGALQFSFSSDVNNDELIFDCDQLGQNFIELWVTDASGNQDFCETFIVIQDNMMHCTDNPMISGLIMTEVDAPVEDVNVDINAGLFSYLTDQNGMYFTADLLPDNDYSVTPELNANPVNGVTTLDMVIIQLHILGLNPLDSPYKMIAADINNSGTITTLDLVVMQKVILLLLPDFPNNSSWRFIDSDYVFPQPSNPWYQPFPEVINFNNLNVVITDADFVAVKIGDVNHSATTTNLLSNDDRNLNVPVAFTTPAQKMEAGENYRVDIFAPDMEMQGCQFTLDFDAEALSIAEILPGIATADQIGTSRIEDGALTLSWYTEVARNISTTPLFSLMVRAEKNGLLENNLRLNARLIAAEAYSKALDIHPASLRFTDGAQASAVYLYQNVPNPFRQDTRIGFHLPKAGPASLTILSVDGKVLKTVKGNYPAGYNEVRFEEIPATGILYYQLETDDTIVSRKMIKME